MQQNIKIDLEKIEVIIREAGEIILEVYEGDFSVNYKKDESPLTIADQRANDLLVKKLKALYPNIPFITEETKNASYAVRKNWDYVWIIDPLDGTKEFIKRNGEFTVNIALCHQHEIVFGMILVPVTGELFYAQKGQGSFKINSQNEEQKLHVKTRGDELTVVASRSHLSQEVKDYVNELSSQYKSIDFVAAGSSLKMCLVAEGKADIYPRLGPTMEWDTAAGTIIAQEAGAAVYQYENNKSMIYNKEDLLNPYFIVTNKALTEF